LYDILLETEKRGIAFDELLAIPEQDDWVYSDGKSTTCVAFILSMYKEAGIFGPISSSIQVTEFTVSHVALVIARTSALCYICFFLWYYVVICRFAMHTCLGFLKIIKHVYQDGATMRMTSFHSARFLVNIGWNFRAITPWILMPI
jgi:hypothetical protein